MQIQKNHKPRTLEEMPLSELVSAAQQASFRALLARAAPTEASHTHTLAPIRHAEAIAPLPLPKPTDNRAMADQLHLRLTNGALAGMRLEAHQQAGKLSLRLRLSETRQNRPDDDRLARLKHELAEHFASSLPIEFLDHDAPTD